MSDKLHGGIKAGRTDVSLPVELRLSATSLETTGKVHTDVTGSYWRQGGTRTAITMATLGSVNAAHSDGGFVEVDATNQPGLYRFDVPDAAFASGADWVVVTVKVASSFVQNFMFALETKGVADLQDLTAAQVNAEADTALADYDAPTNAEMVARTLVAADYATASTLGTLATAASLATVAGYVDTEVAAIKAKTDLIPASPAAASDCLTAAGVRTALGMASADLDTQLGAIAAASPPTAAAISLAMLKYDWNGITGEAVHSLLNAGRTVLNKKGPSGSNLMVYKEDGATVAVTIPITTGAGDPVLTFGDPT